jgi:Protein of unknown function (DUF4232)
MVSESSVSRRDQALRDVLVEVADVGGRVASAHDLDVAPARPPRPPRDRRPLVATVVVLVLVLIASIGALQLAPTLRSAPPAESTSPRPTPAAIDQVIASGRLLGVWTSDERAPVHAPFATHGLALAVIITCSGHGTLFVSIPHGSDEGGDCSGPSSSVGNKAHASPAFLTVRATGHISWKVTIKGVKETYVTPRPVTTARAADGEAVPLCTARTLSVSHGIRTETDARPHRKTEQLTFTNTGSARCALAGYPKLQFLASGRPIGHPSNAQIDEKSSMDKGLRPVVLQPGGRAYVQMAVSPSTRTDLPCRPTTTTTLRISLANRLAGAAQSGTLLVRVPPVGACTNPKALQLFGTVFVDYGLPK